MLALPYQKSDYNNGDLRVQHVRFKRDLKEIVVIKFKRPRAKSYSVEV